METAEKRLEETQEKRKNYSAPTLCPPFEAGVIGSMI